MNKDVIVKQLMAVGLSEREAIVYLASSELGSATAQQIAAQAQVARPTTYLVIETLKERGLMRQFKVGKKRQFSANPIGQLLPSLEKRLSEVEEQKQAVESLSQELGRLGAVTAEPAVSSYAGSEAVAAVQKALRGVSGEVLVIAAAGSQWLEELAWHGGVKAKMLLVGGGEAASMPSVEVRRIKAAAMPIKSEVLIMPDGVAWLGAETPLTSVIVDDAAVAATMRATFDFLWSAAGGK
jgi:predicted transcriptional regulator